MEDMFRYSNANIDIDILKEYYNGIIPKGNIIDVFKGEYPEEFI
jgi:hypothetical protein